MEEYVNENTIVKNQVYELFKDSVICVTCNSLMIEPVICLTCQTTFCKKCNENNGCPNKCDNQVIKEVIGKNNYITKFKFKCIKGCGEEILFDDIKKHYSSNCTANIRKLKPLNQQQFSDYKNEKGKETKDIPNLASMLNISLFILL